MREVTVHYYDWNIKTYQAETAHLSNDEDLCYRRLIDLYYDTEKPIPNANPVLARRLRVAIQTLESVLSEFFVLTDEGWTHAYCEQVIAKYRGYIDRQKRNGALGGRAPKPTANPPLTQCEPTAKPTKNKEPITINKEQRIKNSMSSELDSRVNEIFEYWKIELEHPNSRIDKKRSKAILDRLKEGYTVERIKEAIRGIKLCPHNMGQNERGQVYDDIELICRSGANVDRFADAEFKRPMDKLTKRMADCLLPITDGSDKL